MQPSGIYVPRRRGFESEEIRPQILLPTVISVWHSSRLISTNRCKFLTTIIIFLWLVLFSCSSSEDLVFITLCSGSHMSVNYSQLLVQVIKNQSLLKNPESEGSIAFHIHCATKTNWAADCILNLFFIFLSWISLDMIPWAPLSLCLLMSASPVWDVH